MARCKNCEKKGFFLSVDSNGLCGDCVETVLPQLANDCRIVIESGGIAAMSKNKKTIISRCEVALSALHRIAPFERKGIPALSEPVAGIAYEFRHIKQRAMEELVNEQIFMARAKQESASTPAGKLGGYTRAIDKLNAYMLEFDDVSFVEPAISELVRERDEVRVNLAWQKVDKLLAKDKVKQAKEALSDALVDIKHDTTPDHEQAEHIEKIEAKLQELDSLLE